MYVSRRRIAASLTKRVTIFSTTACQRRGNATVNIEQESAKPFSTPSTSPAALHRPATTDAARAPGPNTAHLVPPTQQTATEPAAPKEALHSDFVSISKDQDVKQAAKSPMTFKVAIPQVAKKPAAATTPAQAAPAAELTPVAPAMESHQRVVRNLKIDTVLSQVDPKSIVLAKQEVNSVYTFAGYQGFSTSEVAKRILLVPHAHRTFHAVIGRVGIACDFYGDIDMALSVKNPEERLFEALQLLENELDMRKFKDVQFIILNGNSSEKHSYHIHAHSPLCVFADYRDVLEVVRAVNDRLEAGPLFDTGVYRNNATLRIATAPKLNNALSRALTPFLPEQATFEPLREQYLSKMVDVPLEEVVIRSLALRPEVKAAAMKAYEKTHGSSSELIEEEVQEEVVAAPTKKGAKGKKAKKLSAKEIAAANKKLRQAAKEAKKLRKKAALEPLGGIVKIFNARTYRHNVLEAGLAAATASGAAIVQAKGNGKYSVKKGAKSKSMVLDENGKTLVPAFLAPQLKWQRYQEVRKKLVAMPDVFARDYDTWAHVGLALHSFASEGQREPLEDFIAFSAHCQFKFDRKKCEAKWRGFGVKNTDKTVRTEDEVFTWRRGYNYLMKTVWRKRM